MFWPNLLANLYFNELTGYLKSGLPLPEILLNSYNQFNQYSQDLVNYDNIRYGTVGYSGNEEVLISQIYAAGGDENPIYRKDFIELYNNKNSSVDLNNWSLQYASGASSNWIKHNLSGSIFAKSYLLISFCLIK